MKPSIFERLGLVDPRRRIAKQLYGAVVAAARRPSLYARFGVPDTPEGRYELVVLHMILLLERLKSGGGDAESVGRFLTETFVTDMDDCFREMGVGDLSVPKKVNRAAAGLYERALAYRAAGATNEGGLEVMLKDALPGLGEPRALAGYLERAARDLAAASTHDIMAGEISFLPPA